MSKIYNVETGKCQLCQAETLWGDAPHGLYLTGQDCPYYVMSLIIEDCKNRNQSSVNVGSTRRRNALIEIWEFLNEPPDDKLVHLVNGLAWSIIDEADELSSSDTIDLANRAIEMMAPYSKSKILYGDLKEFLNEQD